MKKIIMILTNRYDPDVRVYKEAKYLVNNGHEVEILAWDREGQYVQEPVIDQDGIKIKRFFPFSRYGSGIKQIFSYIRFIHAIRYYLKSQNYGYLHCHDLDGALAGLFVKKKNHKMVFDMHEYYEEQGSKKKIKILIRLLVNYVQEKSDNIIYVLEEQQNFMKDSNKKKLLYLPNYPEVNNYEVTSDNSSDILKISYIGAVRQFTELRNLMIASQAINNVYVQINGDGVAYKSLRKESLSFHNVKVTGRFEYSEAKELFKKADILYAVYPNSNNQYRIALPVKLYEAIASCTPLIVSKDTKLESFIKEYDIGFSVDPTNVEELKGLLIKLVEDKELILQKKENILKIRYQYQWETVVKVLDQIY